MHRPRFNETPRLHRMHCTCRRCVPPRRTRTQLYLCLIALFALAGAAILITLLD